MNIYKLLAYIILNLSIYCYIKFFNIGTGTDIQIYYLIFSILYLILNIIYQKKINLIMILSTMYIYFILIICFILGLEKKIFDILRGNFGYISFFIMFITFYKIIRLIKLKKIEQILKYNYFFWTIIGGSQIVNSNLFVFWRNRSSMAGGRGAISFATEPAYFSLTMIFISLSLFLINNKNKKYAIYTLIISLFLAKSSVGIIYSIMISIVLYWDEIKAKKYRYCLIFLISIIFSINYINNLNSNSRMAYILKRTISNPLETLKSDGSLRTRLTHLVFPLVKIKENALLPNGVVSFTEDFRRSFKEVEFLYPKNFKNKNSNKKKQFENKIVSFHGSIIYELGFLGIYIYYFIYKKLQNKKIMLIIMLLGLNGLNISNPLLALLIAISYFKEELKKRKIFKKRKIELEDEKRKIVLN